MTALRIAMWSGPRNISTAMMRAWENRGDTAVWDEPFYAYYLARTGIEHPLRDEVIRAGETDWRRVVARITGEVPGDQPIYFQKHMTHHLLGEVDRGWLDAVSSCFLIRDPREVIASYVRARGAATLEDVGVVQQAEIFAHVSRRLGAPPPVLDARDVLERPEASLRALCRALGVEFTARMLAWPAGPRDSDGVWAKHWYAAVQASTGFEPYVPKAGRLPREWEPLARECEPYYRELHAARLHG